MQIFGKKDNHVPPAGRDLIRRTMHEKGICFLSTRLHMHSVGVSIFKATDLNHSLTSLSRRIYP